MTFNIQAQAWPAGPSSEAEARAKAVCEALDPNTISALDQPDVVVFNEADNEDAKTILDSGLRSHYPNFITTFNGSTGALNDSGLAIFSKFPFVQLPPNPNNVANGIARFYPYNNGVNTDALMEKGVVVVQIATGMQFEAVTLAFTHLQADYDRFGENTVTRVGQLRTIDDALTELLGPANNNPFWNKVIVMGDLNIRGDVNPKGRNEWNRVFKSRPGIFSNNLVDAWRTYNRSPGAARELDLGQTNINLVAGSNMPAGIEVRLDYFCTPNRANFNNSTDVLIPHSIRRLPVGDTTLDTKYREVGSDHKALFADFHFNFPHSTPVDAIIQGGPEFTTAVDPESLIPLTLTQSLFIQSTGAYQWVFMNQPGTYTFTMPEDVEADCFFEDDLSTLLKPYDKESLLKLGFDGQWIKNQIRELGFEKLGVQVDVYKPMFIRFRGGLQNPAFTGRFAFGFIRHTGENPALSIKIGPWENPKNPNLPLGVPNGKLDECWFIAIINGSLWDGSNHNSRFYLQNRARKQVGVTLYGENDFHNPIAADGGTRRVFALNHSTHETKKIYFVLRRSDKFDVDFRVGWESEISYLDKTYLKLFCKKETFGSGSDEIKLRLFADNMLPTFVDHLFEDFDDAERKDVEPLLPAFHVGFKEKVRIVIIEEDLLDHDGIFTAELPALPRGVQATVKRTQDIIVGDGLYQLEYRLLRSLPDRPF